MPSENLAVLFGLVVIALSPGPATAQEAATDVTSSARAVSPATDSSQQATTAVSEPQGDTGFGDEFSDFGDLDLSLLLNTEVVSASQKKENISDAPAVIDVVTPEQIRAWGASTLNDVLQHIPGVEVIENYYGYTNINVRGIQQPLYNSQVLLMIDGIPLIEFGNMSLHVEQVPINSIERIEIIRGPGAVLYGTNAYSAVINVITKEPESSGGQIMGLAGAPKSGEARASGAYVWEGGYARLSAQFLRTPNWTGRVDADEAGSSGSFPMGETDFTALLQAAQSVEGHKISLRTGIMSQSKNKFAIVPQSQFQSYPNEINAQFSNLGWQWSDDQLEVAANLGYQRNDRIAHLGILPDPETPRDPFAGRVGIAKQHRTTTLVSSMLYGARVGYTFESLSLMSGFSQTVHGLGSSRYFLEFEDDGQLSPLQPDMDLDRLKLFDTNAFLQALYRPVDQLSLLAGVRLNSFRPNGHPVLDATGQAQPTPDAQLTYNPRAAIVYRLTETATMKLLYGRAFRLPSLFELFAIVAGVVEGNEDLKPEVIDTVEYAVDIRPVDTFSIRANLFMNFTDDVIARFAAPGSTQTYVNNPGAWIRGAELTLRWLPHKMLDIYLAGGFQEGERKDPASPGDGYSLYLRNIARITANGSVIFRPIDELSITPSVIHIGKRAGLDGVTLLAATTYWQATDVLSIGIVGRNLTDKRYASPELIRGLLPGGLTVNQPLTIQGSISAEF